MGDYLTSRTRHCTFDIHFACYNDFADGKKLIKLKKNPPFSSLKQFRVINEALIPVSTTRKVILEVPQR